MKPIIPSARPRLTEAEVRALLKKHGVTAPVALVGVRGYYSHTFGSPGNDRGVYDDAMFVVSPHTFTSFNANTDPSLFRYGMATLRLGVHWYKKGKHGISRKPPFVPYAALRPATVNEQVPVSRDQQTNPRPGVAINIHRGGVNNTYSEGCQTLPPDQYSAFIALVYAEMNRAGIAKLPYLLVDASSVVAK
jgi:lysozyme